MASFEVARKIVSYARLEWALKSVELYKASEADGIFPALLQERSEMLGSECSVFFENLEEQITHHYIRFV